MHVSGHPFLRTKTRDVIVPRMVPTSLAGKWVTPGEIARQSNMKTRNVREAMKNLVRAGLAKQERTPNHRRWVRFKLTKRGINYPHGS